MFKRNTEKIGDVLRKALKQNNIDKQLYEHRVINSWEEVLGKNINYHTSKLEFKDSVLYAYISSSVVRHELFLMRIKIKEQLNRHVGRAVIQKVIFK